MTTNAEAIQIVEGLNREAENCFKKGRFKAAIDLYTEAITLYPEVPVYWTNRALCHLKQNDWVRVEEDCKKALELEGNTVKARYLLGLVLHQRGEYCEAVEELEKALELEKISNPWSPLLEDIWSALGKAKYQEWDGEYRMKMWRLEKLKDTCEKALKEKFFPDYLQTANNYDDLQNVHNNRLSHLEEVFKIAAEAEAPGDIPEYLCCKISLDICRDPVIVPSGITYDRGMILDHLQKVGNFDPLTREPLHDYDLVPNTAIKMAVQEFLSKHGWAYGWS